MSGCKVKVDEEIAERCRQLGNIAAGLVARGECNVDEAEALRSATDGVSATIRDAISKAEDESKMARPRIGQQLSAWRFCYEDFPTGTVVGVDGDNVTIAVPERIIPAREQQILPGYIFEAEWDDEHEQWIDWSETEKSDDHEE